jgi:hypothetical protein
MFRRVAGWCQTVAFSAAACWARDRFSILKNLQRAARIKDRQFMRIAFRCLWLRIFSSSPFSGAIPILVYSICLDDLAETKM